MTTSAQLQKSADAFRTISEVAEALKLPQHVLRFWETRFTQIKPLKRAGGRRFYRPEDVELLSAIRKLLYGEGYTIRGVQRILKEQGPRAVAALARGSVRSAPTAPDTEEQAQESDRPSPGAIEAEVQRALVPGALDQDDEDVGEAEAARVGEASAAAPGHEPPVNPDFTSRRAPARQDGDGARAMPGSPIEAANRLRAVLAELSECRRLLVDAGQ